MEDKIKNIEIEKQDFEYEDVKRLSIGAFIAVGLAFGLAVGFSVGNFIASSMTFIPGGFATGMIGCLILGAVGGFVLGIVNKSKRKK